LRGSAPAPISSTPGIEKRLTYVNPSPLARRLLWHLYSLATTRLTRTEYHEPFEKPGAHLFWVLSGQGALELESGTFPLKPGRSVWFVDMTQRRAYVPTPGQCLATYGIRLGGPALEMWHDVLGGKANPHIPMYEMAFIRRSRHEFQRLVTRKPVHWEWEVHSLLTQILGKLLVARGLLNSEEAESPIPVRRVLNAVEANPCRDWRARELAAVAGVSYSGLRAVFRQIQGETLHDYLQRARLDQARLLLADLRLSVKEVAERLHFSSEFYFSHFFHRACGLTPTEFRATLKR
jgi:AraC-like DNA-binding protein